MITHIDDGIWTLDGDPISFLSFPYELRMTIVRLGDGSLLLHSPVQISRERCDEVEQLGPVRHILSPNKLHHLFLGDWAEAYPETRLYAPPGLPARRPDLRFDGELSDEPEPAWQVDLRQRVVRGSFFMEEVVFFHIRSSTLILGDLIENHDPAKFSGWQRLVGRLNHMLAPFGQTPVNYRWSFLHRKQARSTIEQMLSWQPRRVIVMHGPCIETDADTFLRQAFAWLI